MRQIRLIIAALMLIAPMAANATLIRLDAVSNLAGVPDFFIIFDDTGDGLLQWDEIQEFSGFVLGPSVFNGVAAVPTVAGISVFSFGPGFPFPDVDDWWFEQEGAAGLTSCNQGSDPLVCWALSLSSVAVPEPGTLALLGIGLVGMGLARRRRKV